MGSPLERQYSTCPCRSRRRRPRGVLRVGGLQLDVEGEAGRFVAIENLNLAVDPDVSPLLAVHEILAECVLEGALVHVLDA